MSSFGESFGLINAPSSFGYALTGNGNEIEGIFSWNPDISHVRSAPYLVVFRTSDNFFYYDETIQVEVALATENQNITKDVMVNNLYPNPANNSFTLPLNLEKSETIGLDIYNILGVKVSSEVLNLSSGKHLLIKKFELENGNYFVNIVDSKGVIITTKRLVVVK